MSALETAVNTVQAWVAAGKPRSTALGQWKVQAAVVAALESIPVSAYWRGTNRKGEATDVRKGVQIISTNHVTKKPEAGMSVSKSLASIACYGYKYAYQVAGELVGEGSDGEPVLINCKVTSKVMAPTQARQHDTYWQAQEALAQTIADAAGVSVDQVYRIREGRY